MKYRDRIVVTDGFYEGMTGTVVEHGYDLGSNCYWYGIRLDQPESDAPKIVRVYGGSIKLYDPFPITDNPVYESRLDLSEP